MKTDALSQMRVIDIANEPSGAYCARLLADFGADVVKIEDVASGGDPVRRDGLAVPMPGQGDGAGNADSADGDSARFLYLNQNKRSVALDLESEQGRALARRLVLSADVVVDGVGSGSDAPGGLARIGLSREDLQRENPGCVIAVVSPFGLDGPYADRPACHLTVAALSGWLKSRPGDATREPIDVGFPMLDFVAASVAAVGVVAAWRVARKGGAGQGGTGQGAVVDVSQQEVGLRMYLYPTVAARVGLLLKRYRPFPMYVRASNGYAAVNALNAAQYRDVCLLMGLAEESEQMNPVRTDPAAVPAMQAKMDAWAAEMTREDIFEIGQAMKIPAGVPYTLLEVVKEPAFHERGFFRPLETRVGVVQQPAGPIAGAVRSDWKDAPALGADTAEVVGEWLEAGETR